MIILNLKDKLIVYIYNKNNEIEKENEIMYTQVRFHKMDSLDHYEMMRRIVYNHAWQCFLDDLYKIIINVK